MQINITKQDLTTKQELTTKAWEIRRQAAKFYNRPVTQILWGPCMKMAHNNDNRYTWYLRLQFIAGLIAGSITIFGISLI